MPQTAPIRRRRHGIRRVLLLATLILLGITVKLTLSAGSAVAAARAPAAVATDDNAPHRRPVKVVAPERLKLRTAQGEVQLPAFMNLPFQDGARSFPNVRRAVIVMHGRLRDADRYFELSSAALKASAAEADTLLIAPQMISTADAARHDLPASVARWRAEGWMGGEPALGPAPVSSFEFFDAIAATLADRSRFPNLERIVFAGHSGGGQVIQRYAVVGRAEAMLGARALAATGSDDASATHGAVRDGIRVRYVVANPSSYVYFDTQRPVAVAHCGDSNHWRYGMANPVPYISAQGDLKGIEARYDARRVIYLLGGADTDPNHKALDKSCMAEAQGVNRLQRGNSYFAYLQRRASEQHLALNHTRVEIPGVGHEADRMFNSVCGRAALFGTAGCELKPGASLTAAPK